ncbi:MAG: hypothetical protein Q9173_004557 [Seirophora scorigena]
MRYIRPVWLTHSGEKKDFEVYSCHVSPDGSRLVTAAGDGYVRVWSTEAVFNAADPAFTGPKQLASMSYHSGTIHTVRFSNNGRFLASGADDKIVCVYTLDPHPPSHNATFGTDEPPPVETWRIHRRLIGHDNDVQDLGWSYDSSILVSVGLDSKVVVWSGYTFEKLKTISSHASLVKGITFDPANKYFATASDDRTVKLWRFTPPGPNSTAYDQISNFVLEKNITAPFVSSPLTTYFRRCSWSPDGNHIAAANAVNGPVSSVAIINRASWDGDIHLIGHEGPVEVCAFSPRLFSKFRLSDQPSESKGQIGSNLVTVIACAGQDKSLTVWITSNPRPLVITQDVALKALSDLAWTPDGTNLFVTSLDGSIICVSFDPGELGYEVSQEETEKTLEKFGAGRRGAGIIEGTNGLLLEERSREDELRGAEGRMGALMGDAPSNQIVSLNGSANPAPRPAAVTNGVLGSDDVRNGQAGGEIQSDVAKGHTSAPQIPEDPNKEKLEKLKSRVTITKDGKKRIAPLLLSSSGGHESSLPRAQLLSASRNAQGAKGDAPQTILDLSKPFDGLPKGGLASLLLGNKRKLAKTDVAEDGNAEKKTALTSREGQVPILTNSTEGLVPAQPGIGLAGQQPTPDFIRPAVVNPSLMVSQVRLAIPKLRRHIVQTFGEASGVPMRGTDSEGPEGLHSGHGRQAQYDIMIEARNPSQLPTTGKSLDQEPCRITVFRRGQPLWQDFLPRSTLLLTGNKLFWAAACEDGSVCAWTPAGRRLVNALVLESQPVILECKDKWLLCVTAVGMCYVWDMKTLQSPHPPVSLAPVLDIAIHSLQDHVTAGPAVTSAHLNSEGRMVVSLSTGDGFAYSPSMYVWQRLTELWWAVGSQYWNTTDSSIGDLRGSSDQKSATNVSAGVVPFLERGTAGEIMVRGKAFLLQRLVKQLLSREGYEGFESSVSLAHLENRMAAAMMLGSKDEFQVYLYMYAKRLGAEGLKSKVEELLRGLLGGVSEDEEREPVSGISTSRNTEDRTWDNTSDVLCGWPRKELLKAVVLILGKNRDLQRITVPYANVLGVTTEPGTDGDVMSLVQSSFQFDFVMGGVLEATIYKLFRSPGSDAICTKSPKLLATPSQAILPEFDIPSGTSSSSSSSSSATSLSSSTTFWRSPTPSIWSPRRYIPTKVRKSVSKRQLGVLLCALLTLFVWIVPPPRAWGRRVVHVNVPHITSPYQVFRPIAEVAKKHPPDPQRWLERNSNNRFAVSSSSGLVNAVSSYRHVSPKPRAALISLVRNSELDGIVQSMTQLEHHWNRKYHYPWVFFNDEPFSDEFKAATRNLTLSRIYYEVVPKDHWSLPDWIDEGRFMNSLEYLGAIGVGKGWMISYRHMCRWNSGFFYRHPRLKDFDWYWRVEPDVHFFCDIDYDVFRFMRDNNMKYGFNMNILDDARSFPSLWSRTRSFINAHPELIHPEADLDWLLDARNSGDYNNCQFFSNFEVGDLNFFRGKANEKYFDWLDRGGGFYYERFGDAPIHTLSVAMFVPKKEIWFFRDIGYQHDINRHCPPSSAHRCSCEPTPIDENFYRLVPLESPQKKPDDTCIRQFLGGSWLEKKSGWSQDGERMFGGDGYHGYELTGLES